MSFDCDILGRFLGFDNRSVNIFILLGASALAFWFNKMVNIEEDVKSTYLGFNHLSRQFQFSHHFCKMYRAVPLLRIDVFITLCDTLCNKPIRRSSIRRRLGLFGAFGTQILIAFRRRSVETLTE